MLQDILLTIGMVLTAATVTLVQGHAAWRSASTTAELLALMFSTQV